VLIVDSIIISGVRFVLNKLIEAVNAEMYDESALREELLAAQMKLELGEITEAEFESVEEAVLAGLREVAARKNAAAAEAAGASGDAEESEDAPRAEGGARRFTIESVEAELGHREDPDE
jgi:hypothetical protein